MKFIDDENDTKFIDSFKTNDNINLDQNNEDNLIYVDNIWNFDFFRVYAWGFLILILIFKIPSKIKHE